MSFYEYILVYIVNSRTNRTTKDYENHVSIIAIIIIKTKTSHCAVYHKTYTSEKPQKDIPHLIPMSSCPLEIIATKHI